MQCAYVTCFLGNNIQNLKMGRKMGISKFGMLNYPENLASTLLSTQMLASVLTHLHTVCFLVSIRHRSISILNNFIFYSSIKQHIQQQMFANETYIFLFNEIQSFVVKKLPESSFNPPPPPTTKSQKKKTSQPSQCRITRNKTKTWL